MRWGECPTREGETCGACFAAVEFTFALLWGFVLDDEEARLAVGDAAEKCEAAAARLLPLNGAAATPNVPPLEINVNGKTIPVQLGNPLEIQVGKERVRIVVQQAP